MRWLYFLWLCLWFFLGFFILFPFFLIIIQNKKWHKYYYYLAKTWAKVFYVMIGIKIKIIGLENIQKKPLIFCANHFSYLDIPLLTYCIPHFFVFVGLHNLGKIPLFGYMYRNIHILVNRASLKDRYRSFQDTQNAIKEGKSLVIFPEGGIWTTDFPLLSPFKDGAFRLALQTKTDILPVTLVNNWQMMPLLDIKRLTPKHQTVIFHNPISPIPQNNPNEEIKRLQNECFEVIAKTLEQYFKPPNPQRGSN